MAIAVLVQPLVVVTAAARFGGSAAPGCAAFEKDWDLTGGDYRFPVTPSNPPLINGVKIRARV